MDIVGAPAYQALTLLHHQLRVMILRMGNENHSVDKSDGLVVVGKAE
jgi:hypothetical protein